MGLQQKPIRGTEGGVDLFSQADKVGSFSKSGSFIGGSSIKLEATSPADIFLGEWMGNPATVYLPSNIVTPQICWMPLPPALGVIGSILWGIKDILAAFEGDLGDDDYPQPGKIVKNLKMQVVDYGAMLPEDV